MRRKAAYPSSRTGRFTLRTPAESRDARMPFISDASLVSARIGSDPLSGGAYAHRRPVLPYPFEQALCDRLAARVVALVTASESILPREVDSADTRRNLRVSPTVHLSSA